MEFDTIETIMEWECYRLRYQLFGEEDTSRGTAWLAHPDTALLRISFQGTTPFLIKGLIKTDRNLSYLPIISDGTASLKKLYVFPLSVGKKRIADEEEEREVIENTNIKVPAGKFSTLKIKISASNRGYGGIFHLVRKRRYNKRDISGYF